MTTAGDVVLMNPVTGEATRTLVSGTDAIGDAVSISAGTIYFAVRVDCVDKVESVPLAGGPVTVVTDGAQPAISPDGAKLAFVRGPDVWPGSCDKAQPGAPAGPGASELVIRDLSTGSEHLYPAPPKVAQAQIPAPISHLSWSPDGGTLLLSISSGQDNEGWDLVTVDPPTAQYYLPVNWAWGQPGGPGIPVTGKAGTYYFEGVQARDGNLFVDRVCCAGVPVKTTSNLLDLISANGTVIRQVAMGFLDRAHTSLAVDPNGHWLLYLSGQDLFLSGNGGKAVKLTSGVIAATWQ